MAALDTASGMLTEQAVRPPSSVREHAAEPISSGAWDGVLLAVPAYNEERFIGSTVIEARLLGLQVLVIDDGSTDRTAEIASGAGAWVERHETNRGKSEALNTAFRIARSGPTKALVLLDGDGQHHASEIHRFLQPILSGEADIVIGSRFLSKLGQGIPHVRRFGQRLMTWLTNMSSGVSVTDSQSGFRAFSPRAIEKLRFASEGFGAEVEMQFRARDLGLRLAEVPIRPMYLDPPKRNVFSHGAQVLNSVLTLTSRHRPLLFFSTPGLLLLLLGLAVDLVVVSTYQHTQVLATGYALMSIVLDIAGLLSLFAGLLLHSMRGNFMDLERSFKVLADFSIQQYIHRASQDEQSVTPAYRAPVCSDNDA